MYNSACTIGPGVIIYFTNNTGITFRESTTLTCNGTEADPIIFTGYQGAIWKGLLKDEGGNWFTNPNHFFEYVQISGSTRGYSIDRFSNESWITFHNCDINVSGGGPGLSIGDGPAHVEISDVLVQNAGQGIVLVGVTLYPVVIEDCVARNCSEGFSLYSTGSAPITASGLLSEENTWGIGASRLVTITTSEVTLNDTGFRLQDEVGGVGPSVLDCDITNNNVGVLITTVGTTVNECRLHDNKAFDVNVTVPLSSQTTTNCRNCYWGPITTQEMVAEGTFSNIEKIHDWWDDGSKSLVDFEGFIVPTSAPEGSVKAASWGEIKASYR